MHILFFKKVVVILRQSKKHANFLLEVQYPLTLIYPPHFEDVPCQSGVNHIYEG